jgi:hypothetical protein
LKSSLGTDEINNNTHSSDTEEEESVKKVSKKRKTYDLTDYLKEGDEMFLEAFKEMQDKQNSLMEKLINKL